MNQNTITTYERLERQRILPSSDIPPHEFLFRWHDIPCFARGELVALTGKAKSGKTYLNSILMANGLRATGDSTLGLHRIRSEPLRVLWIDTEQSEDSTHEILRDRISTMICEEPNPEQFFVYNLRQVNWQEREELVEAAILLHQPDLVLFDGIRDVVGDINDYTEAQNVIGKLLSIASFSHACIVCVLHQNKAVEDKTLRGALGTELQNKSFETYECQKSIDSRIFTVTQMATRKYDIRFKPQFSISSDGLPIACCNAEDSQTPSKNSNTERLNPAYVDEDGRVDHRRLFEYILPENKRMSLAQLRQVVMKVANVRSFNLAYRIIVEACSKGLVRKIKIDGTDYYESNQQKTFF